MSIKWGYERLKDLSNPVKKAEEVNEWGWWGLFIVFVIMVICFILEVK